MKPSISLVAWEERKGNFIFVAVPNEVGRYLRTDKSVATVECPQCGSVPGEPCKKMNGYGSATHYVRRNLANKRYGRRYGSMADDCISKPRLKLLA